MELTKKNKITKPKSFKRIGNDAFGNDAFGKLFKLKNKTKYLEVNIIEDLTVEEGQTVLSCPKSKSKEKRFVEANRDLRNCTPIIIII